MVFYQLLTGSLLIGLTVLITTAFIGLTSAWLLRKRTKPGGRSRQAIRFTVDLFFVTLLLLAALTIAVWIWAAAFLWLGVFEEFELSLYFSVVSFTTLGFGDVVLDQQWRLLSGLAAANGLILFSLSTAVLIEFIIRAQADNLRHYYD